MCIKINLIHEIFGWIYKYSFLLACLLHDIGHAPFSHTCENLFSYKEKINNKNSKINKELLAEIKSHLDDPAYHVFEKDYFSLIMKNPPAPHEIMSSIITCRKFGDYNKFFESENINSFPPPVLFSSTPENSLKHHFLI